MKKFSTFLEAEGSWRKETPWRKVKPGPRKDKYGNTVKDKNVARNLARSAMKKTASGKTDEATMSDKNGPGKGKDMRDMSKLDHAKARDYHQYKVKSKGDYHSKMAKIHHANAIGGSSMLHKEGYIGAKGEKGRSYHNAGTFDKDTAYSHAKKHNGVVHKDPSGKYLVKHGRGKHVGEDVQELSTDKLKQYKTKAAADAANAARAADRGDPEAASRQDKRNRGLARAMKKEGFAVKYNNPGHEKHGREKHFDNKMAADKHANRGNKVDKVGGKYTVHKTNDKGHIVASYRETNEATYQGKKVPLNKPMPGDVKKSKVYVDPDGDGIAKKVNFGDKNMRIKKNIPGRRKSFRARHNCDNPGPKDKARYWSCKAW